MKALVFDMDNTLNKFYDVEGWLDDLHNSNPRPYIVAEPKYNMAIFTKVLEELKKYGWRIIITTWLSKDSTKEFDDVVRVAKTDWLKRYNFNYDEIHIVKYGTTKANCTRAKKGYQILFDDNEQVRKGWTLGKTVDANNDILEVLQKMLLKEISK